MKRFDTMIIRGIELRSTSYAPNFYVSQCATYLYNTDVPHCLKIILKDKLEYAYVNIAPKKLLHRAVAFAWVFNPCPDLFNIVDHISRDTKDSSATNLRWVNCAINNSNRAFGVGVSEDSRWKKFVGRVNLDGKTFARKTFKCRNDAAVFAENARREKLEQLYKENVDQQQALTPDYKRTPGYLYWRDATGETSSRSPTFMP